MASLNEVEQSFTHAGVIITLGTSAIVFSEEDTKPDMSFIIEPTSKLEAHTFALMLRRAARRLEGIGENLPEVR